MVSVPFEIKQLTVLRYRTYSFCAELVQFHQLVRGPGKISKMGRRRQHTLGIVHTVLEDQRGGVNEDLIFDGRGMAQKLTQL